jgi:hypothetical protein
MVNACQMTVNKVSEIVESLRAGRWLKDDQAAIDALSSLGFAEQPSTITALPSGLQQHHLDPAPGIDHATLSSLDGEPTSVIMFIASSIEPASPTTRSEYETLIASLTAYLGSPRRVWADEPTPLLWPDADLDIGVQLFDRHDSTVMVWVEHRKRAEIAEQRAMEKDSDEDRRKVLQLLPAWGPRQLLANMPISDELRLRLRNWNRTWQSVLDPVLEIRWPDAEVGRQWIAEGESLVRDLQVELPQFLVVEGFSAYDPDREQTPGR